VDHKEYIKTAKFNLEEAYKLLERGDPYNAAEKTWAAVRHTTTALTTAFLKEAARRAASPGERLLKPPRQGRSK
jgi:HEPN domain-containing protein